MKKIWIALLILLALCVQAGAEMDMEGEWMPAEDATVTEETARLVQESLGGLVGVEYTPVAYLGCCVNAQETTHAILCQARVVVPDAKARYVVFYVSEDLQRQVELLKIADFDIGMLLE